MKPKTIIGVAFAALAAAGAGVWTALHRTPAAPAMQAAIVLPQPRPVADFALTDQDGAPFGRARLTGRWSLVFAGYTSCPDICPNTLAVLKALEARTPAPGLQTVFVSVDPERDSPERLRQYVRYFSPNLVGATGPAPELDKLCSSLGVAYMKVAGSTPGGYAIDHSAALALVNPKAEVTAYFQPPHKVDVLAADLARIMGPPS